MDAEDVAIYNLSFRMSLIRCPSTRGNKLGMERVKKKIGGRGLGRARAVRDKCKVGIETVLVSGNSTNGKYVSKERKKSRRGIEGRTAARLRWSKTLQHAFHTEALPYFC
jgi:hypothetical protein